MALHLLLNKILIILCPKDNSHLSISSQFLFNEYELAFQEAAVCIEQVYLNTCMWSCWSGSRGGLQRSSESWSTTPVKQGQGRWACSFRKREGSREISLWPSSASRKVLSKRVTNTFHDPVVIGHYVLVTGEGRMALN